MTAPTERERYGIDWSTSCYPNYPRESDSWALLVEAFAPDHPDAAEVFMASHLVMGLTRIATGARGLAILRDWFTPGFAGRSTISMIHRTVAWSNQTDEARQNALAHLDALLAQVQAAKLADDPLEVEELDLLREQVTEQREQRRPPAFWLGWLPACPLVRKLERAAKAFHRTYPFRYHAPLDTAEKVAEARAAIAREVTK